MATTAFRALTVETFEGLLGFELDTFQREAIDAYLSGRSVLVAAPTGTGKTAIAEFATLDALRRGARALYTTPIKALSNQKFRDFGRLVERAAAQGLLGDELNPSQAVGLLTGDIVVNASGPLLVMTTEVLRNMLVQARREPEDAGVIVFDEVHYMGDPERGTAWEESILLSPPHVPLVCLSATVPNADQVAAWIRAAHGELDCILHVQRAVPLEHRYFLDGKAHLVVDEAGRRRAHFKGVGGELAKRIGRPGLEPERDDDSPWLDEQPAAGRNGAAAAEGTTRGRSGTGKPARRESAPWEVIRYLENEALTPAIYFLFSRRACEEAAASCVALRTVPHAAELVEEARRRLAELPPADRSLRQVALLFRLLPRGVAVHHAGMLPVVKMLVEELFASGRLRAVFSTDTLALGINMPARTVVIGEMSKWDGQQHRLLLPNEYQQMTGRAGRRGIDARGVSVVLYSPWVSWERTMGVITGDLLPLESAFSPSYSTALNLWQKPGDQERLADLYARSFRRFQRATRVELLANERDRLKRQFDRLAARAASDPETWELARELAASERLLARERTQGTRDARAVVDGIGRVLERFGYLAAERPTYKAAMLRSIFDTNALTLAEVLSNRWLEGLEPAEIAEVCSWFAFDRDTPIRGLAMTRRLYRLHEEVVGLNSEILEEERRARVTISQPIWVDLRGVALAWAEGEELGDIARRSRLAEGDLVGLLQKTIDILNQLRAAVERAEVPARRSDRLDKERLLPLLAEADALLRRGVVEASYRWALSGPSDDEGASADWTPPTFEDDAPGDDRHREGRRGPRPHGPRAPARGPGPGFRRGRGGPRRGRDGGPRR